MLDMWHQSQIVGDIALAINQAKDILTEYYTQPFLLYHPRLFRDGNQ
jgi:hypothetical protein